MKKQQVEEIDTHKINGRLLKQVDFLLTQIEAGGGDISIKDRYMALVAICRLQAIFVNLRKEKTDEPDRGSAVRLYEGAFASHGARRRKATARAARLVADEPAELDLGGDDGGEDGPDDAA